MLTEMFGVICPFNEYYWKYCVYMPGSSHPETICSFIFSWSHKRPISSSLCIIGFVKQASCRHLQHGTCKAFISPQCNLLPNWRSYCVRALHRCPIQTRIETQCHLLWEDAVLAQDVLKRTVRRGFKIPSLG